MIKTYIHHFSCEAKNLREVESIDVAARLCLCTVIAMPFLVDQPASQLFGISFLGEGAQDWIMCFQGTMILGLYVAIDSSFYLARSCLSGLSLAK